jgi:uncharacterized membrane protein
MKHFFKIPQAFAQEAEDLVFGDVKIIPEGVDLINQDAGGNIGIILFISNMIKLFTMLGGLFVIINIVLAAFLYITKGDSSDSHDKVRNRFTMSVIGILLMIAAYSIAGLVGLIFYRDPTFILSPKITEIGGGTP